MMIFVILDVMVYVHQEVHSSPRSVLLGSRNHNVNINDNINNYVQMNDDNLQNKSENDDNFVEIDVEFKENVDVQDVHLIVNDDQLHQDILQNHNNLENENKNDNNYAEIGVEFKENENDINYDEIGVEFKESVDCAQNIPLIVNNDQNHQDVLENDDDLQRQNEINDGEENDFIKQLFHQQHADGDQKDDFMSKEETEDDSDLEKECQNNNAKKLVSLVTIKLPKTDEQILNFVKRNDDARNVDLRNILHHRSIIKMDKHIIDKKLANAESPKKEEEQSTMTIHEDLQIDRTINGNIKYFSTPESYGSSPITLPPSELQLRLTGRKRSTFAKDSDNESNENRLKKIKLSK